MQNVTIHMNDGRTLHAQWDAAAKVLHCGPFECYGATLDAAVQENIKGAKLAVVQQRA